MYQQKKVLFPLKNMWWYWIRAMAVTILVQKELIMAKNIMIILTGAGISIIVLTMSVHMIMQTSKEIKNIKKDKE